VITLTESDADTVIKVYENKRIATSTRFDRLCNNLSVKGIKVYRYSLEKNREQFILNQDVWYLIICAGIEMLPATYVNGHIRKIESYPNKKEMNNWIKSSWK
jgi:hypothetical protein